jgi:hypothetical protein
MAAVFAGHAICISGRMLFPVALALSLSAQPGPVFVHADVLLVRAAAAPDAQVLARLRANTQLAPTAREDGRYVEVHLPPYEAPMDDRADHNPTARGWVARDLLGAAPLDERALHEDTAAALDARDGARALRLAERLAAITGRAPAALTRLAEASALVGDEARTARLHEEMERPRVLVGACTPWRRVILLGELHPDGRFERAVHTFASYGERSAIDRREERRLESLAREVTARRFLAWHDDVGPGSWRPLEGSPFGRAKVLGLEAPLAANESDRTGGLKVLMGPCQAEGLVATAPLEVMKGASHSPLGDPKVARRLLIEGASVTQDRESGAPRSVSLAWAPGENIERSVPYPTWGHHDAATRVRWGLFDAEGKQRLDIDHTPSSIEIPWFRHRGVHYRLLPWGGEVQSGLQMIRVEGEALEVIELPSVISAGC